jgi:hypothetical protein
MKKNPVESEDIGFGAERRPIQGRRNRRLFEILRVFESSRIVLPSDHAIRISEEC